MWLAPAYGGELRLAPDLDAVEALSPEREALWARMERASFLSDAEKRAAVGYGEKGAGGGPGGLFARKYRTDQARDDQGRWVDEGGVGEAEPGNVPSADSPAAADGQHVQLAQADDPPPIRRMHPDTTYERDRVAKDSLDYWRKQPTDKIIDSLKPGGDESLRVRPDGTIVQGNTRTKILQERGVDINSLPRESAPPPAQLPPLKTPRGGGGSGGGAPGGGNMRFRQPPRI